MVIAVFGCGCTVGILSFSHLLSWTLRRWHAPTIACLTGLMMGSLNKVWPWKIVVETFISSAGEVKPLVERNVFPGSYLESTGNQPYLAGAVLVAVLGFLLVFFIDKLSSRSSVVAVIHEREARIRSESDASGSR
jgi:putative membrane protein